MNSLEANIRDNETKGQLNAIRKSGNVRAIIYGGEDENQKISVSKNISFSQIKVSGAFHGAITVKQQMKIPKILKLMQFPCADALSYSHLCEGKIDVVFQATNKIWDIHPLIPIIKAAGGVVSTWNNNDAIKAGNIVSSANLKIQNKILKLLKPVAK